MFSFTFFENKTIKKIYHRQKLSIYRNIYLTYMGERRSENVLNLILFGDFYKHQFIIYMILIYLLSDKGILWIQFKKDSEIPKGEIYRNENSVMRYQEW